MAFVIVGRYQRWPTYRTIDCQTCHAETRPDTPHLTGTCHNPTQLAVPCQPNQALPGLNATRQTKTRRTLASQPCLTTPDLD